MFLQRLKPWMLPIAMLGGIIFHSFMEKVEFIAPYLIFLMLYITFCKANFRQLRVSRMSLLLLLVQIPGSLAAYYLFLPLGIDVAQGAFICVFCPTATAAPVITAMLGGSISALIAYSIISNISVAFLAPVLFTFLGSGGNVDFLDSMLTISEKVIPLILLPLIAAVVTGRISPRVRHSIATHQQLSFYIWAVSLFIVVGRAVTFVMAEPIEMASEMILIAVVAGVMCAGQFYIGRRIGNACGDKIAGAQGLGQKNTVLAIWMALSYLNPVSSVGPAAYIAWQNTINSLQLYFKSKKETKQQ